MGESVLSSLGISPTEDTSLVLPSDKNQCRGQQRVLQQVNSIKRSKSKIVRDDSLPSPTSPLSVTEYSEPKFQFSSKKRSISLFSRSSTSSSRWQSRMNGHSVSVHKTVRRPTGSIRQWGTQSPNGYDPMMNGQVTLLTQTNNQESAAIFNTVGQSQSIKVRSKSDTSGMNDITEVFAGMTLQEAVNYLKHSDVNYQLHGASYIQHHTFCEETAKKELYQLRGIQSLIELLDTDNALLQQIAAAALRNVVFKESLNKKKVQTCGGIDVIFKLIKSTTEIETKKELTGLLWNLSSDDILKPDLNKSGLLPLTEGILVPYTMLSESNSNKVIDSEIFYNTTGCLRNLSCSNKNDRIAMRNCQCLIDSLVAYVHTQIDIGETDDKSLENCVCILHNLSYQLDQEAPEHFFIDDRANKNKSKNGLFSTKSTKDEKEYSIPGMEESKPKGVRWLYNRKSLERYMYLLKLSQNEATLDACCGVLQNLTASSNPVSTVMSKTIVEDLNGLPVISILLNSSNKSLQKTAMSLVGNMSRVSKLRPTIAKTVLPHVSAFLTSVSPFMVKSDDTIFTACRVFQTLGLASPKQSKKLLNRNLIKTLSYLSEDMSFPKARKAAGVLLYSLWRQKDFHNTLKKQGMCKDTFVNEVTAASYRLETGEPIR